MKPRERQKGGILLGSLVGVDIGGTTTRVTIGNSDFDLDEVERFPTRHHAEPEALVAECKRRSLKLLRSVGATLDDVKGVGVVVPGSIDVAAGTVRAASNLKWTNVPLGSLFSSGFGCEARVENDANAAALAEWHAAEVTEPGLFLYLGVGTGFGAGLICGGRIWRGCNGLAGEIGHTTIERGGPVCPCGSRGCLEVVASGLALERLARKAVVEGTLPKSVQTVPDLVMVAASGNETARGILEDVSDAIAIAVKNLVYLLDPAAICLGGGIIHGTNVFADIQIRLSADPLLGARTPRLLRSALGDDAGLTGALHIAAAELRAHPNSSPQNESERPRSTPLIWPGD